MGPLSTIGAVNPVAAQARKEGRRLPVAQGRVRDAAFSLGGRVHSVVYASRRPSFIMKDQFFDLQTGHRFMPRQPRLLHVCALLFAGVHSFLKARFHLFNRCHSAPILIVTPCCFQSLLHLGQGQIGSLGDRLRSYCPFPASRDRQ